VIGTRTTGNQIAMYCPRRSGWSSCVIPAGLVAAALAAFAGAGCVGGEVGGGDTATGGAGGATSGGALGGSSGLAGASGTGGLRGSGGATAPGTGGGRAGSTGAGGAGSGGASGSAGRGGATGMGGTVGGTGGGTVGGTGGGSGACTIGPPLSGGTQHCSSNASGAVAAGYSYTIWSSGTGGCVIPYGVGAAFKATWNNSGNYLGRVGLALGSNKTFDQFGTFAADYAETKTGSAGGFSYVGIYGWSVDPLHEFYIIDDWFGSRPNPGTKVGTIAVDGGTYDIMTHTQVNQPAITGGNTTFVQFWSLRTVARQCGHISISEHFKAWANAGLTLGNLEEAKILVEVGGGSGSIDFTSATLTAQ
jgi:endo-1,4-beta-xylanase